MTAGQHAARRRLFAACSLIVVVVALSVGPGAAQGADVDAFTLTVLHTNDVHSHFVQTDPYGSRCKAGREKRCVGGVARQHHMVRSWAPVSVPKGSAWSSWEALVA